MGNHSPKKPLPELEEDVPSPSSAPPDNPPNRSMQLLQDIMDSASNPAYSQRAQGRVQTTSEQRFAAINTPLVLVMTLLLGVLFASGRGLLRLPLGESEKRHDQMVQLITERRAQEEDLRQQAGELRTELSTTSAEQGQGQLLSRIQQQLKQAEKQGDFGALFGSGLVVEIEPPASQEAEASRPGGKASQQADWQARQLSKVVNALWSAGAHGVEINGHRLQALSSIRFASSAVLVNYQALQPPYVIKAVGSSKLHDAFSQDAGAALLRQWRQHGARVEVSPQDVVQVSQMKVPSLSVARISS